MLRFCSATSLDDDPVVRSHDPDHIFKITDLHGDRLTKVMRNVDGRIEKVSDYGRPFLFRAAPVCIATEQDLAELILSCGPNECLINGALTPGTNPDYLRRTIDPYENDPPGITSPCLEDCPRRALFLDLDGADVPAQLLEDLGEQHFIDALLQCLPAEFHAASCVIWLTASHGIDPNVSRARAAFLLDTPLTYEERKAWLPREEYPFLDPATFQINQPIYCAPPIFEGSDDPYAGRRVMVRP